MSETAKLTIDGKEYVLPIVTGTEGERAIDIRKLRADTGLVTLDNGYTSTGATKSAITYIDGEAGILRYRGIPIEQLAEKSTFVETAYLLIHGNLPTADELERYSTMLTYHSMVHEDMRHLFNGFPSTAHPMAILSAMMGSLSAYYPDCLELSVNTERHITRAMSKIRTIVAYTYKKMTGHPIMYPKNDLSYVANFLHMMFAVPAEPYEIDPDVVDAMNLLLILHADHEQNCSTSTVRLVGSSNANLYGSISAGIYALWGPLHGGANQAVMEMLRDVHSSGIDYKTFMEDMKSGKSDRRLMGFGHRVYKNHDPRAAILKKTADKLLAKLGVNDPLLDVAKGIEEVALSDDYFVSRKLYPNVDFYSGIIYKAIGIPEEMFTVMFALGRLPGWIAQWKEMMEDPKRRIGRPRQIYTGNQETQYVPIEQRGK